MTKNQSINQGKKSDINPIFINLIIGVISPDAPFVYDSQDTNYGPCLTLLPEDSILDRDDVWRVKNYPFFKMSTFYNRDPVKKKVFNFPEINLDYLLTGDNIYELLGDDRKTPIFRLYVNYAELAKLSANPKAITKALGDKFKRGKTEDHVAELHTLTHEGALSIEHTMINKNNIEWRTDHLLDPLTKNITITVQCLTNKFTIALLYYYLYQKPDLNPDSPSITVETREKLLRYSLRYLGNVIHTIQDSYSESHCGRDPHNFNITTLYDFSEQNSAHHILDDIGINVLSPDWYNNLYRPFHFTSHHNIQSISLEKMLRVGYNQNTIYQKQFLFNECVLQCVKILNIYVNFTQNLKTYGNDNDNNNNSFTLIRDTLLIFKLQLANIFRIALPNQ